MFVEEPMKAVIKAATVERMSTARRLVVDISFTLSIKDR
jgi:hypothetical protein